MYQITPDWWLFLFSGNRVIRSLGHAKWCEGFESNGQDFNDDHIAKRIHLEEDSAAVLTAALESIKNSYSKFIARFPSEILDAVHLCDDSRIDKEKGFSCKLYVNQGVIFLETELFCVHQILKTEKGEYPYVVPGRLNTKFRFTGEGFVLESIETEDKIFRDMVMGGLDSNRFHFYASLRKAVASLERGKYDAILIEDLITSLVTLYEKHPETRKMLMQLLEILVAEAFTPNIPHVPPLISFFKEAASLSATCSQLQNIMQAENAKLLMFEALQLIRIYKPSATNQLKEILVQTKNFLTNPGEMLFIFDGPMKTFFSRQFSWSKHIGGYILSVLGVGVLICAIGLSLFSFNVLPPLALCGIMLALNNTLTQGLAMAAGAAGFISCVAGTTLYCHHQTPKEFIEGLGYKPGR